MGKNKHDSSVFLLALGKTHLVYAPLRNQAFLVDSIATRRKRDIVTTAEAFRIKSGRNGYAPEQRIGDFLPDFIGLIPTRGCNLDCHYCGFRTTAKKPGILSAGTMVDFIEWYARLLHQHRRYVLNIHFFGGEPFLQPDLCAAAVRTAEAIAGKFGMQAIFEAATNGFMNRKTAEFVRDSIDFIVLSLDGPREIHDRHRPRRNGQGSFERVYRNAKLFSEKPGKLSLRSCITSDTVGKMVEIAEWFQTEFHPACVCFETLQESTESMAAGLKAPDPWEFAFQFIRAEGVLQSNGIETVYATADIHTRKMSFCPVGRDVAILSPDGIASGCYLLQTDWEERGMNMRLGTMRGSGNLQCDRTSIERVRAYNVWNKPRCRNCFCKWNCAGGCHVHHTFPGCGREYDALCIQTRVITLYRILKALGREDLFQRLNRDELQRVILQKSDLPKWRKKGVGQTSGMLAPETLESRIMIRPDEDSPGETRSDYIHQEDQLIYPGNR